MSNFHHHSQDKDQSHHHKDPWSYPFITTHISPLCSTHATPKPLAGGPLLQAETSSPTTGLRSARAEGVRLEEGCPGPQRTMGLLVCAAAADPVEDAEQVGASER